MLFAHQGPPAAEVISKMYVDQKILADGPEQNGAGRESDMTGGWRLVGLYKPQKAVKSPHHQIGKFLMFPVAGGIPAIFFLSKFVKGFQCVFLSYGVLPLCSHSSRP